MEKISLRGARVNAGLQVAEAAEALGVQRQTINGWELDSTRLNYEKLMQLSKLYHVPYNELFIGSEKDYHEQLRSGNGFNDSLISLLEKQVGKLSREHSKLFKEGADGATLNELSTEATRLASLISVMLMNN